MIAFLGILAGVCTSISFVPQAIQVIKTKKTEDIYLVTYCLFSVGVFFWIIYGGIQKDPAVFLTNIVTFIPAVIILTLKFKSVRRMK